MQGCRGLPRPFLLARNLERVMGIEPSELPRSARQISHLQMVIFSRVIDV